MAVIESPTTPRPPRADPDRNSPDRTSTRPMGSDPARIDKPVTALAWRSAFLVVCFAALVVLAVTSLPG
ncbi:hypothetical protein VZC37_20950 [Gordonia sp. LSe1-13]|uniref:Uncharacterized protein n=1 Tax=Gordonia sesuvii TaxID=3116777 RepID=A0ABU7MI79_9ACTN|nr:hypothetical protein [Gordonia sp. LSe1-13]